MYYNLLMYYKLVIYHNLNTRKAICAYVCFVPTSGLSTGLSVTFSGIYFLMLVKI